MVCEQGLGLGICSPGWEKLERIQWQCGLRYWVTSFGVCSFLSWLDFVCWVLRDLKFIPFHKGISHGLMCSLAHTGIGHFSAGRCQALQQGSALGTGGADGAEFPACSQPCPPAPHWARPASVKGHLPSLPKSRCGTSIFCRWCRIWLENWGQKEAPAWGKLLCSFPLQSCSWHPSGTPEPCGGVERAQD